jgi:hypothetical protein
MNFTQDNINLPSLIVFDDGRDLGVRVSFTINCKKGIGNRVIVPEI